MKNTQKQLVTEKQTAYLLSDYSNRRYFTGVDIAEGTVIVTQTEIACFTDARYFYGVKDALIKNGVTPVLFTGTETLKNYLDGLGIKTVYIDYDTITVRDYKLYKAWGYEIKDGATELNKLRAVKTEREILAVKRACEITEKAFYKLLESVKEGVTELELKLKLLELYRKYGAEKESFDTIIAFGKNSAVPHHQTGETVLSKGMPILIDTGCVVDGYSSDFTRTVYYGTPTDEFINAYNAVKVANEIAIEKIKDGTYTDTADGYARSKLKEYGLDEYFTHSLGHGLGLDIHEYPTLSKKRKDRLVNNMLFTIEPGVYFDGKFGIRIEDTVLLDGKCQRLYTDKKDLIIL